MLLPAAAQAGTVQNLSAPAVSSTAGGVPHVRYSFSFQVQTALGNTDNITIAADAGTVLPSTATVHDDTTNANFGRSASGGGTSTITVNLCCTDAIAAGDTVTVTLDNVTNPAAGSHTIAVSTSKDTAAT